jgi:hypothetical protein
MSHLVALAGLARQVASVMPLTRVFSEHWEKGMKLIRRHANVWSLEASHKHHNDTKDDY